MGFNVLHGMQHKDDPGSMLFYQKAAGMSMADPFRLCRNSAAIAPLLWRKQQGGVTAAKQKAAPGIRTAVGYSSSGSAQDSASSPGRTRVNLGVLKEDEVNIIVHGHEPTLSEMILAAVNEGESFGVLSGH